MSDKTYYWLKLPKDFFKKHYIEILLSKENGQQLVFFYIWLLAESIDHEGRLRYSDTKPYDVTLLQNVTKCNAEFVTQALQIFTDLELLVTEDDGTLFLPKSLKMIGSECASAKRVRAYRQRKNEMENTDKINVNPTRNNIVTECNASVTKSNIEIEKEIDIEKDNNIYSPAEENQALHQKDKYKDEYKFIIDYLNKKCGTNYKHNTEKTRKFIRARLNEGFTEQDFYTVIDKKYNEWHGSDMEKYLRPETLFGTKFESYLNQKGVNDAENHRGIDGTDKDNYATELDRRLAELNRGKP